MAEITKERAEFAGLGTTVLRVAGEGPPVVLLPGYSDIADTWRGVLRELGDSGRAALAADLPGSSIRTEPGPRGGILPQLDRFVGELVRAHAGEGPVLLSGNSLGGVMSLRAAAEPDLPIAGIVPMCPAGLGHQPWVDTLEQNRVIRALANAPISIPAWLVRRGVALVMPQLVVGQASSLDREAIAAYASQYRTRHDLRRLVGGAHPLLGEIRDCYELERIRCPVLLVWGARDRLVPPGGADRVLEAVPGSRLVLLEKSGHCPQLEEPGRIAELLIDFDREARGAKPKDEAA